MEYRPDVCMEEGCPVCGDKVSGYHYGLLTCESCKGFFKRTVQNNKKYICAEYQECRIDKSQRKRCPFCRFQKCLHVGMRLEAVRADRMRGGRNKFGPMYKRDRALKQQRHLALTEATGGLSCSPPLVSSALHRDLAFTGGLLPGITLPTAQSDCISYQYSLHPNSSTPAPTHYQCTSFSDWAIKLERSNNCGASSEGSVVGVPPLVLEFLRCDPDELQLQRKVSAHLMEHQTGWEDHDNPSTFSLMCHMADQTLISIVEWARSSIFFKQLKVGDQMKLLQSCWSDLLLLDLISRQVLYGREGRLLLVTGQEIELADIASHAGPTLASLIQRGQELVGKLDIIKVDRQEFACIKFLILFNPDVKELDGHQLIESVQEQVEGALLEYTLVTSSHLLGRFAGLLLCVSELRVLSSLAEEYLCYKHLSAEVPCNSLLIEMLYAKCNWD